MRAFTVVALTVAAVAGIGLAEKGSDIRAAADAHVTVQVAGGPGVQPDQGWG